MARHLCDRCPSSDDLAAFGGYDLCPPCLHDAQRVLAAFVTRGRKLYPRAQFDGRVPPGARWAQCMELIEQHGYVTCRIFRLALGVTAELARDYLYSNKDRGKLESRVVDGETRFYLPGNVPDAAPGNTELAS